MSSLVCSQDNKYYICTVIYCGKPYSCNKYLEIPNNTSPLEHYYDQFNNNRSTFFTKPYYFFPYSCVYRYFITVRLDALTLPFSNSKMVF